MGRFVPVNITPAVSNKAEVIKYTAANLNGCVGVYPGYGAKAYYNGKECWQYKVVFDRPGSYCFQVPSNAICARTVLVGGGGKPKCISVNFDGSTCNSAAGAGGGYSEKCHAVTPGVTGFCLIVGRQEADTTLACNGTAVHSATGAAGMIPGNGSGGDFNSRGGCSGFTCNYCTGSYSHYCGSCKYFCFTTICGYCIVFQYTDAANGSSNCCNGLYAGGGSAGSPVAQCGGNSSCICGYLHSMVAGGGAGIGSGVCRMSAWHYSCCNCICPQGCNNGDGEYPRYNYPSSAEGGGGSKAGAVIERCRSWDADCTGGRWRAGNGGPGGPEGGASHGWMLEWGYDQYCAFPYGTSFMPYQREFNQNTPTPCRVDWWDITNICGNGAPATISGYYEGNCNQCLGWGRGPRPMNSGEGAGTGGIAHWCCNINIFGNGFTATDMQGNGGPLINWPKICSLGTTCQCDQAWLMQDALFPYFITCAGTLGGSGGTGYCGATQKAGKGGGGGQSKCQPICICYGGAYDCCSQAANTPLAFPPCILDMMIGNAGTGMAIIYYREA